MVTDATDYILVSRLYIRVTHHLRNAVYVTAMEIEI
jgi:hypothetical protein